MPLDVVAPLLQALTVATGVPLQPLAGVPPHVRRAALLALARPETEIDEFLENGARYLVHRYHRRRDAVVVLGPFRRPEDPAREVTTLDPEAIHRAASALRSAGQGFRQALEREAQRLALASQLEVVGRSVLAVTGELTLDTVLRRIVDLARELSGARYAALGVPGPTGELEEFVTSGMTPEEEARVGERPRGRGVLGLLLREPKTIRLADLSAHPASVGFPAQHPPMKSFLGVPIMSRGRVLGNLYLTEKRAATEFSDADAYLVELLARHAAVAIENARLYAALETQQQWLQLTIDQLPEAVLLVEPDPERVTLANRQTFDLLGWTGALPMPLDAFMERNARFAPDGTRADLDGIPVVQSLRRGEVITQREVHIGRPDGSRVPVLINSAPVVDAAGRVRGAIAVFQDITQIKDAEQLKDDFLSLVSHELRTPLTTVQAGATLLLRDWEQLDADTRLDLLGDISTEGHRLGALIESMVQLANVRAGRMTMETEPVHVASLVAQAVAAVHELAPEREFALDVAPRLLADADPSRIDQVIRNLLHNAVKYSPADSPIEIAAAARDDMVEVAVRDHGPGLDADELPFVFERFRRGKRTIASGTPGMGVGLYLARHIVEAHGGRIWVERAAGGGTRVAFTVPAIRDDA
jgi:PAS domain S-box-containing protein